ncbi:hypothetical protein A5733_02140 [Mycobacterium sp. NS-7484]|uniref:hypothetical protein n=1 Tax=Mycobacterium sp. NS-7484 TaxID=1834161 RepID=UPI00097ABA60|nr:hypothetical protein [Mycobacterium sp. NS-7484]OMC02462.1 hypothetical protein A5733_02140 [Mycobacterium sp. NS-7484]
MSSTLLTVIVGMGEHDGGWLHISVQQASFVRAASAQAIGGLTSYSLSAIRVVRMLSQTVKVVYGLGYAMHP